MSGTMDPAKRYAVYLNNLRQKKLVDYEIVAVSEGLRHDERWTTTILFKFALDEFKSALVPRPGGYTAIGKTKGEALTIASFYALQHLGYIRDQD
ncbi:hypothetical protein FRB95_010956 [Tulasnella sp. JGI-2019a]|nr:hypothetical protein FRB93_003231 [Tulasnella sp. JGI-2019a]KAG9024874.1 hypothetical protein FRB95_010956 [Tulasnella sp. JGI-2019a]